MDEKKEKLIISGNALYEIDLECICRKKMEQQKKQRIERTSPVSSEACADGRIQKGRR